MSLSRSILEFTRTQFIELSNENAEHMSDLFQAAGSYSHLTDDYTLSLASGQICITLEPLQKEDIEHLISCLECMLETGTDQP